MPISNDGKLRIIQGAKNAAALSKKQKQNRIDLFNKKCIACQCNISYEKRRNRFCSQSCSATYTNKLKPKRNLKGLCKICNTSIASGRTYCSICYANNKANHKCKKNILTAECIVCGIKLPRQRIAYCSHICRRIAAEEKLTLAIEKGELNSPKTLRNFMLRNNIKQCDICKIQHWTNKPVPLTLDHVDGNSENNKRNNLRLICPNCDALLPTYKGRNKGSGRAYRRQRYAEGKSY